MMLKLALILVLVGIVHSRPYYRDQIPNGYSVPNPCGSPPTWNPVGHYNPIYQTTLKNPFANDFRNNAYDWPRICALDSDKDGRTNGEELGDPNCTWVFGTTPSGRATGHPGICEPVGSTRCVWQNFACDCLETCSGLVGYP